MAQEKKHFTVRDCQQWFPTASEEELVLWARTAQEIVDHGFAAEHAIAAANIELLTYRRHAGKVVDDKDLS